MTDKKDRDPMSPPPSRRPARDVVEMLRQEALRLPRAHHERAHHERPPARAAAPATAHPARPAEPHGFHGLAELGGAPLPGAAAPLPTPSATPPAPVAPEALFAQLLDEVDRTLGRRAKTVHPQLAKVQKALAAFEDADPAAQAPAEADQRRAALAAALDKLEDLCEVLLAAR